MKTWFIKKWNPGFTFTWIQDHWELFQPAEHPLHPHLVFCEVQNSGLEHWATTDREPEFLRNSRCKGCNSCFQGAHGQVYGVQDWVKLFILQASKVVIKTGSGLFCCFCFEFF